MENESEKHERLRKAMEKQLDEMGKTAEKGNEDERLDTIHYLGQTAMDDSTGN